MESIQNVKKCYMNLAEEYKFQILAMEVMPDHIHLLVDCKAQFYISDMIKIMKGNLCAWDVSYTSGVKRETVGRASVESFLLCHNGQRQEQRPGACLYRRTKGKRKEKSLTEEMICWRKRDADSIQLWRRSTKTEYPDPPDTGDFIGLRSAI